MTDLEELLERFRRGAELVAVVTTGAAGAVLDYQPAPGKWSIRQIVCHLADSEMVAGYRFRRVIAEENPILSAYDQDAWAVRLDYGRRKFSHALESFRRLRAENFDLLRGLPREIFERTGRHEERGVLTLKDLLRTYAEHAENHARQITEIREAYRTASTS